MPSVLIASGIIFYISRSFVFNYLVYENTKHGIQIKYPSNGWQIANPDDFTGEVLKLFPTNRNKLSSCPLDVFISINDVSEEKIISVDKYKNLVIKKIKNISPKSEIIDDSDSATTLSNFKAYELVYTRQDGKCNLRVMEIGTVRDGKAYYITYTAEEKQFSELLPTVEKMINSFQIMESN
ncbi:MAG: hypothetical protein HC836_34280 [Richelia sp. RM2_1_2]|nr:hypothetical protein [Richelia sp. RM2_1_2]